MENDVRETHGSETATQQTLHFPSCFRYFGEMKWYKDRGILFFPALEFELRTLPG
jgi:hypothetical protein